MSEFAIIWLVVIMISLFTLQMKSATMSNLMSFRYLLMLMMCEWAKLIINSVFISFMGTMICFLDSLLIIILILSFLLPMLLFVIFIILTTLFANKVRKAFLI